MPTNANPEGRARKTRDLAYTSDQNNPRAHLRPKTILVRTLDVSARD